MSNTNKKSTKPSTEDCLTIANNLIARCHLSGPRVIDVSQINSNLIVLLYEMITGTSVPDLISDEAKDVHNIQAVINALSLDFLQLSLSHISGEAIVAGDALSIYNLLHVLEGIHLHSYGTEQTLPKRKISRLKKRETPDLKENTSPPFDDMENVFEKNAELKLQKTLIKDSYSLKVKSTMKERNCLQHAADPPYKSTNLRPCHKSFLLPYTLRKKHSRRPPMKKSSNEEIELIKNEAKKIHKARSDYHPMRSPTNFIQELLDEFPCIQISPSTMKNIENMYAHQLITMHKRMKTCTQEKSRAAVEAENISKRQLKLADVLKKDISQQKYLSKVRRERDNGRKISYCLRDSRIKSAKMKQYSDEFVLEMRKKMLTAANTAEELIFRRVFRDVMDIQNDHVNDLCQQVREARMNDDQHYLTYLNSLENLYQTQYLALSEEIANERSNTQTRLNAEKEALAKTEREFRERLKSEIRFMQRVIVEQTEDCHFREMDADLYIDEKRKQHL